MADTLGAMLNTIFATRNFRPQELLEFMAIGEEAGLRSFWAGDHLNWYVPVVECLTALSFVAGHTQAKLGTNVLVAALREPVLTAKMAASIDYLAPGGLDLGIGVGGEHPVEFQAMNIPIGERGARTDEAIDLMRRVLREAPVDFEGRFYTTHGAQILPRRPLRILVGGRSERAFHRVVQRGDGWTGAWVTPAQVAQSLSRIRELAEQYGRPPEELRSVAHVFVRLGTDRVRAWDVAADFLSNQYSADPSAFERYCVLGHADAVGEVLEEFLNTGLDELLVSFVGPDPVQQMEQYSTLVLPHLVKEFASS